LEADKQALLNYLLGGGVQQEQPPSHVIRQDRARYARNAVHKIPVPTREEIEAQRRREAAKAESSSEPEPFRPMNWSAFQPSGQPVRQMPPLPAFQPPPASRPQAAAQPRPGKINSPLWERVQTKR